MAELSQVASLQIDDSMIAAKFSMLVRRLAAVAGSDQALPRNGQAWRGAWKEEQPQ
jgi:hypothetical protein